MRLALFYINYRAINSLRIFEVSVGHINLVRGLNIMKPISRITRDLRSLRISASEPDFEEETTSAIPSLNSTIRHMSQIV